jgi:hypothetical protein
MHYRSTSIPAVLALPQLLERLSWPVHLLDHLALASEVAGGHTLPSHAIAEYMNNTSGL